ncbi:Disaggregatase related repeat protein [uncultured archaeon]|nr:Disaggregatase related repeat protein [uncultured archaeon]
MYNSTDKITNATLSLFWNFPNVTRDNSTIVEIYRPQDWNPNYVNWNNRTNRIPWRNQGGYWFDKNNAGQGSVPFATITFNGSALPDNRYHGFNVTELVQGYTGRKYANTGFFLKARDEYNNYIAFQSTAMLMINYTIGSRFGNPKDEVSSGGGRSSTLSSSGSGGGAGGASGENYTNIEMTEKYDRFIYKDITTPYSFRKIDNPVVFVNITGNTNAGEINVAVEVLRNTSSLVKTSPDGIIYKNIHIWVGTYGFATPDKIKKGEITFRVKRSWIEDNSIDLDSINMMHYDGSWQSMPTQKISENDAYLYYKASANSFSPFVITGNKSNVYSNGIKPIAFSTETQKQQEKSNENMASEPETPESLINFPLIGLLLGIVTSSILVFKIKKSRWK